MRRIALSIGLCMVMLSAIAVAAVHDNLRIQESRVRFEMRGAAQSIRVQGEKLRLTRESGSELRAMVPMKTVSAGNPVLDERIRKQLEAERCPNAVFAFDPRRIALKAPRGSTRISGTVSGQLLLRCQSQPATALYIVERHQRKLTFFGAIRIDLKDYGIEGCLSGPCGTAPGEIRYAFTIEESW